MREVEVGESDVAVRVQQDVFGLEVPVDDAHEVKVLEGHDDLGRCRFWLKKEERKE